jgi:hypothetical protein
MSVNSPAPALSRPNYAPFERLGDELRALCKNVPSVVRHATAIDILAVYDPRIARTTSQDLKFLVQWRGKDISHCKWADAYRIERASYMRHVVARMKDARDEWNRYRSSGGTSDVIALPSVDAETLRQAAEAAEYYGDDE